MQVWIKSFDVEMQVKQSGIELEVRSADGSEQLGDCYANMTGLVWCEGRKRRENGVKLKWSDFALLCSSDEVLKTAIQAAKAQIKADAK
ncbi:hypothetical protein [Paraburkholderia graminis]|jgi:hypothetical protein|uniref:hypothetical protein n=1 Tax=Paraburkholderia graminis TaxID=60548 RepID=UPI0038B74911